MAWRTRSRRRGFGGSGGPLSWHTNGTRRPPPAGSVEWWPSRLRKNQVKRTSSLSQTCCPDPRRPAASALVVATRRGAGGAAPGYRSSWGLGQVADADQVVRRQAEDEHPTDPGAAPVARLAQQPHGLEPAEDLFDALAGPLAHLVAGVARGARIDRTRPIRGVLGDVRRHLKQPERLDEVPSVIALVGAHGDPPRCRPVAQHL